MSMCDNGDAKATSEKLELLYDGIYYDVTNWIKKHPGGTIINLYTKSGEDSTLAVQQLHQRSTKKVMSIMKSLPHRKQTESDLLRRNEDSATQEKNKALTADFLELYDTCKNEGLFDPSPLHVFLRLSELFIFIHVGLYCSQFNSQNPFVGIFGVICLGLGTARSAWVMHEGGHHSLLGNPRFDRLIQKFVMVYSYGLSGSYWTSQHSRHHAMPQHVQHDVDLRTLPLLAFNAKTVKNPKDGKTFLIQNQKWLFLVDAFLVTLAWRFYLHPRYCILKGKYGELFCMMFHYIYTFSYIGLGQYCLVSWFVSISLLGNFMLNHSHLPVTEEPTHWVEYSLTHTANIRSSTFGWVDYWMGNLNYQIEHHLFPTMPQYKNKLCRDKVKALAKKHNLPYQLYSYGEAVMKSFDNLSAVSKELAAN